MEQPISLRPYLPVVLLVHAGIFVTLLNSTMTNVSLPDIGSDLGVSPDAIPWVITSYIASLAISATIYGRLADLIGLKKVYLIALAGFALMSLAVGFAPNFLTLILFRILQGFFAGGIIALAPATIVHTVPLSIRSQAFGILNVSIGLGLGLGPLAGAVGIDFASWRIPLLGTAVFAALLIPLAIRYLPLVRAATNQRFDIAGGVLMSAAVGTAFIALTEVPRDPTALVGLIPLALTGPLWISFLWWIRHTDQPFVPPALLGNIRFLAVCGLGAGVGGILVGSILVITVLFTDLFGSSSISAGLYLLPGALVMAFLTFIAGRLAMRVGDRIMFIFGGSFLLIAVTVLAIGGVSWDIWAIAAVYTFLAAGFALVLPSLPNTVERYLPPDHVATGFGIFNFAFFFGGPIAIALETRILRWREGITDAITPLYNGPAAAHADSLFVVLIMSVATIYLILRYIPRRQA